MHRLDTLYENVKQDRKCGAKTGKRFSNLLVNLDSFPKIANWLKGGEWGVGKDLKSTCYYRYNRCIVYRCSSLLEEWAIVLPWAEPMAKWWLMLSHKDGEENMPNDGSCWVTKMEKKTSRISSLISLHPSPQIMLRQDMMLPKNVTEGPIFIISQLTKLWFTREIPYGSVNQS